MDAHEEVLKERAEYEDDWREELGGDDLGGAGVEGNHSTSRPEEVSKGSDAGAGIELDGADGGANWDANVLADDTPPVVTRAKRKIINKEGTHRAVSRKS